MAEKILHQKSINEIQEDLIDIKLKSYQVSSTNATESNHITQVFGNKNGILKGKIIPFFYSECLDVELEVGEYTNAKMLSYFRSLKHTVKVAFDIPAALEQLEDFTNYLDKPVGNNINEINASKKLLPRYKKMKKLEQLYDTLVRFTLTCIHNFFWTDITLGVEKGVGTKNPSHRIKQLLPLMLYVKKSFEAEIEKEFPADKYEKELTKF